MRSHRFGFVVQKEETNWRHSIKTNETTSCFAKNQNAKANRTKTEGCTRQELKSTNKMAK